MPNAIRVDNGQPFGDPRRCTVPPLALWLISIGINVIWNRPRRPTDNAQVERMQGTTARWAEVKKIADLKQLQQRLEEVLILQRERCPVRRLGHRTRAQAFPQLKTPLRTYLRDGFEPMKAYRFLSQRTLVRKVSSDGRIALYGRTYQLGTKWAHQEVQVSLDALTHEWVFRSQLGKPIRGLPARNIGADEIWSLSVCKRT